MTKTYSKTRILVEGALMIALSTVLSMIQIPLMPHGGSITLFSMVPILVMSYRHGAKWGIMTAFVNSLIQLVQGLATWHTARPSRHRWAACCWTTFWPSRCWALPA